MRDPTGARSMVGASRVQLVPPATWDEERLLAAARSLQPSGRPVRPGDPVGDMIVTRVEPSPGATLSADTEFELLPDPVSATAALVDLFILLDVSESMAIPWDAKHTRLEAARASLEAFLAAPGPSVASVTLAQYAKEARVVAGPAAPGELVLGEAPTPKGRSSTAQGIELAIHHLAERLSPERSRAIILLTDGVGDVADLLAGAARASHLKTPIHALVFAPDVDEVFETIARSSGGSCQRATYPLIIEFEHEPGA